jgi:hypothetical protein
MISHWTWGGVFTKLQRPFAVITRIRRTAPFHTKFEQRDHTPRD